MRIGLDPGDSVAAGQTIITRIEPTDPELLDPRAQAAARARVQAAEARLEQATSQLEQAQAAFDFAASELRRARELSERQVISQNQLEQNVLAERTATEELRATRFAAEIARFELEVARAALLRTEPDGNTAAEDWYFEIRSPIDGRVLRVFEESATVVAAGAPLLELGDPQDLEVVVDVLSSDAVRIEPGHPVRLEQWGGDEPLHGRVRLVEPSGFLKVSALGVEEQRVNVVIDFRDPPTARQSLGDGFRVEAKIVVWEAENVLKIPIGAMFRHGRQWAVFVIAGNAAELRPVKIGHRNDFHAEVLSGLSEGEQIVVHPADDVTDGVGIALR